MKITNNDEFQNHIKENVLTREEAIKITQQTKGTFSNAVSNGYIPVFVKLGSTNLYLKEDIVNYTNAKKERASRHNNRKVDNIEEGGLNMDYKYPEKEEKLILPNDHENKEENKDDDVSKYKVTEEKFFDGNE